MTFSGDYGDIIEAADFVAELVNRPRTPFSARAACRDHPGVSWHPELGESAAPAKAICAGCEVRQQCLAFALARGIAHGIWGGLSPKERRQVARSRRAA